MRVLTVHAGNGCLGNPYITVPLKLGGTLAAVISILRGKARDEPPFKRGKSALRVFALEAGRFHPTPSGAGRASIERWRMASQVAVPSAGLEIRNELWSGRGGEPWWSYALAGAIPSGSIPARRLLLFSSQGRFDFVQSRIMKAIATLVVLCSSLLVAAQTPVPKSAAAKSGATHAASAGPRPSLLNPSSLKAKAPAVFKAKFTTTAGDFVVEVHRAWAPNGADRFYNLVRYGYFTNAAFFRVVPGFVVQFGLSADPAVNKVWKDAKIQDDPVIQSNKRGNLVFASAGPNTRTTQLFINFADNARLDGMGFAPFGSVVDGMTVVDKIFPAYGESPRQDLIQDQGDAYLKANFRDIDRIKLARIVPALPPATHPSAAAKPATKPAAKPAQ